MFVNDNFLDEIRKFDKLEKLSVYLHTADRSRNNQIKRLSIDADALYLFLKQIKETKVLSIYDGIISSQTIDLIKMWGLNKLKLHNTIIKNCSSLISFLLNDKGIMNLKLTSDNYLLSPQPTMVACDIITRLEEGLLNVIDFTFTVDPVCNIRYENLKHLTKLKKLKIYYSAQSKLDNVNKLINISRTLLNVKVTFIEYFDTSRFVTRTSLVEFKERSGVYKTAIKNIGNNLEVRSLNFEDLQNNNKLLLLD